MVNSTTLPTNTSDWSWRVFTPEFITTRLYDSVEKYLPTSQFLQLWIKTKKGKLNTGLVSGKIRKNAKTQRCLLWISILFFFWVMKIRILSYVIEYILMFKIIVNYFRIFEVLVHKNLMQYNNKGFL